MNTIKQMKNSSRIFHRKISIFSVSFLSLFDFVCVQICVRIVAIYTLFASYFPIFRVSDTFPSLKMNADVMLGYRNSLFTMQSTLTNRILRRYYTAAAAAVIVVVFLFFKYAWQQIKMKFLYLTNQKRLRFIGVEKYCLVKWCVRLCHCSSPFNIIVSCANVFFALFHVCGMFRWWWCCFFLFRRTFALLCSAS